DASTTYSPHADASTTCSPHADASTAYLPPTDARTPYPPSADATTELAALPTYPPDGATTAPSQPEAWPRPGTPARPDPHPPAPDATPGGYAAPAGVGVEPTDVAGRPAGRAGRDLRAAIGVGLTLGAVVIASLFVWRPAFLGVVVVAICVATWELARAVRPSGARPSLVPLLAGGVAMTALAWYGGAEALTLGLVATVITALVWRLADGPAGYHRDLLAAVLIAVYVPFLGGFAVLLLRPDDGALRVVAALAGVVLSDTGGYIAGVLFGRHPMAPSVSPKKTWEGFAGSLVASAVGGALLLYLMLGVAPWYGAVFGLCVAAASVLGDFAESLLKRDLGIKDMSNLLPGHGGAMDRLDSVLFAAPTAYAVLALVAPAVR
ncbi:MAG: phosphatidate cytidylyltransferase, partial [Micromonosporaceae bacterium]|nr:phosphatidate cytidylyltransferase [Micromonosporaceae bacterium]